MRFETHLLANALVLFCVAGLCAVAIVAMPTKTPDPTVPYVNHQILVSDEYIDSDDLCFVTTNYTQQLVFDCAPLKDFRTYMNKRRVFAENR